MLFFEIRWDRGAGLDVCISLKSDGTEERDWMYVFL